MDDPEHPSESITRRFPSGGKSFFFFETVSVPSVTFFFLETVSGPSVTNILETSKMLYRETSKMIGRQRQRRLPLVPQVLLGPDLVLETPVSFEESSEKLWSLKPETMLRSEGVSSDWPRGWVWLSASLPFLMPSSVQMEYVSFAKIVLM